MHRSGARDERDPAVFAEVHQVREPVQGTQGEGAGEPVLPGEDDGREIQAVPEEVQRVGGRRIGEGDDPGQRDGKLDRRK